MHEYTVAREKGTLLRGTAFLQFCLFDSHADPTGEDLSYGFAYEYKIDQGPQGSPQLTWRRPVRRGAGSV